MASFLSALSLFVLILFNGCFTLPIVDEQLSTSTLENNLTTEQTFHLTLVSDDETTVVPDNEKLAKDKRMGFEMTTSVDGLSEEKVHQITRAFDEDSTSESFTSTTEQPSNDKRDDDNDLSFTTAEPIIDTTQETSNDKRDDDDQLSVTTDEQTTQVPELQSRDLNDEFKNQTETNTNEPITQVQLTTNDTPSFTPTSSNANPQFSTSDASTSTSTVSSLTMDPEVLTTPFSTSTVKYVGLLKDENEEDYQYKQEYQQKPKYEVKKDDEENFKYERKPKYEEKPKYKEDYEHKDEDNEKAKQSIKFRKPQRKESFQTEFSSTRKSQIELKDKSSEDSPVRTAVFDQEALTKISNIPNDFLILDENTDLVVTGLPEKIFTSTMKYKQEGQGLNQV